GLRATQLYLPNNPVYQRAVDNIRAALRQIWQATDDLVFDVGETDVRWEDAVVYSQDNRSESIAWTLYKDGVRSLAFKPGIEDVDTTLYFLEDKEVEYLKRDVEREYAQDLRRNVLAMLFDLLELQTYGTVRAELISILENFIPYLLGAADFRSVAFILRETRVILQRARELIPEHRQTLETMPTRLSQREALSQLIQSLDEATVHPTEEELSELFQELRAEALVTLIGWLPRLNNERVRDLVHGAAARLAQANAGEVLKALASEDSAAQLEMVKLAGRLKLPGAPDGMEPLLGSNDRTLKLAVVEALTAIASPSAM